MKLYTASKISYAMKNYLIVSLVLASILTTVSPVAAQQVEEKQYSLITKRTATWCPLCGGWGWNFFKSLISDNKEKAILWAAHHSGDLVNSVSEDITSNLGGFGQPRFYVNNDDKNVTSSNTATKRQQIRDEVDDNFQKSPQVNAGLRCNVSGRNLSCDTRVVFFQNDTGHFYVSVYIIENGVINDQAGRGNNVSHPYVLRGNMHDSSFGVRITDDTVIASGSEYTFQFNKDLPNEWEIDSLYLTAIIWDKQGDTYYFQNGSKPLKIDMTTQITSADVEGDMHKVQLRFDPERKIVHAYVAKSGHYTVRLVDLQGRPLLLLYRGMLAEGHHQWDLRSHADRSFKGILYVQLISNGVQSVLPVIVR